MIIERACKCEVTFDVCPRHFVHCILRINRFDQKTNASNNATMRRKSYIAIRIAYGERYAIESYTTTVPIAKSRIFLLVFAETCCIRACLEE